MKRRGERIGGVVVGLDLGTTKICAIIAEAGSEGGLQIIGVGSSPSEGLRRGVIVDVEKTVQAVRRAVQQAELMAGVEVMAVYAGIAGEHIGSLNSRGVVAISGSSGRIGAADRSRVLEAAQTVSLPIDREILHVLPQEYSVDGQMGIRDPVGMYGVRLEADVHIVTGAVTSAQNICRSILRAGFEVRDIVLEPLASSYAVLDEDEREMGVCLIDMGGGTTDVALFCGGSVRHTAVIGLGGQNVTNDVAIGLRTSWPQAERLKCAHGAALAELVGEEEEVQVPGIAGRPAQQVTRRHLTSIIEARMEEIFTLARRQVEDTPYGQRISAGVVLTGGGALVEGAVELAERIFLRPARLGLPRGLAGMMDKVSSPIYSTALGLVLFGMEQQDLGAASSAPRPVLSEARYETVFGRMKEWFQTWV